MVYELYVTLPTVRGPCSDFVLGLSNQLIAFEIETSESLQKNRKQFASQRKGPPRLGAGNCLYNTSIPLRLLGMQ